MDAAGNILTRRAGTDASLAPVLFGSHIDSVPNGGNFDGDRGHIEFAAQYNKRPDTALLIEQKWYRGTYLVSTWLDRGGIRVQPEAAGTVRVAVEDTGVGIDRQQLDQMFTAFYTTKAQGLGMGLAISRSIVEQHGGRLWAENGPDGGARFNVAVPLSPTNGDPSKANASGGFWI